MLCDCFSVIEFWVVWSEKKQRNGKCCYTLLSPIRNNIILHRTTILIANSSHGEAEVAWNQQIE